MAPELAARLGARGSALAWPMGPHSGISIASGCCSLLGRPRLISQCSADDGCWPVSLLPGLACALALAWPVQMRAL